MAAAFPEDAFASIANLRLPTAARLLPTSWCPDKDLLAVILRSNNRDKLSLWKMQGAKKWEISFDGYDPISEEIVDLAWSTNGTGHILRRPYTVLILHCRHLYRSGTLPTSRHFAFDRKRAFTSFDTPCHT